MNKNNNDDLYKIYNNNKFIGLGIIEKSVLKRDIIIWQSNIKVIKYQY